MVTILNLSVSSSTRAEGACQKYPSVGLYRGRIAPFNGILVQPPCITEKATELRTARVQLDAERSDCAIALEAKERAATVDRDRLEVLEQALLEEPDPLPLWGAIAVGLAAGFVAGVGATIAVVKAVQP